MGVGYALILAGLFQELVKQLAVSFRPYFLDVCQPVARIQTSMR